MWAYELGAKTLWDGSLGSMNLNSALFFQDFTDKQVTTLAEIDGFDPSTETVENAFLRWVVYTPWATAESTGLPPMPTGPGAPWLMFPGTAGAHIMITPPPPGTGN